MKNKIVPLENNMQISSCESCHMDTIKQLWCANCVDRPDISKWTLNPIQSQVLEILENDPEQSLVIASKTGTGKSLMAYMAIRKYYESGKKGKIMFIQPLKQIVREKVVELTETFSDHAVLELTGDTSETVGYGRSRNEKIKESDIIVMSYEMLDSLTRKPEVYTEMRNVGMLIIDEIHSIGDRSRGGKLDGAITRFLLSHKNVQVVALSATFDNIQDLENYFNQFLTAKPIKVITSEFSPIRANIDPVLYTFSNKDPTAANALFVGLFQRNMKKDGGVLCLQLSIPGSKKLADALNSTYGSETARAHYSEMETEEKYRVIDQFNNGEFKTLCATPTVLAGVNIAATVLILNLGYFDPIDLTEKVLPPTSIRQAAGRVGRLPRYKEGWVFYIVKESLKDEAQAMLTAENVVHGALNATLHQVLNLEISLKKQSFESLQYWYDHTYSGYSSPAKDEKFKETIQWLVDHQYIDQDLDDVLSVLPKGAACAKYFIDPVFFETCYDEFNGKSLTTTQSVIDSLENLASTGKSPFMWNQRKTKQFMSYCNFEWMKDMNGHFDWNKNRVPCQWADQINFQFQNIVKAAAELKLTELEESATIIDICTREGPMPLSLVNLYRKLVFLGKSRASSKYLLYLALNNVRLDAENSLQGPSEFKNPRSATYLEDEDNYLCNSYSEMESRYLPQANALIEYYGTPGLVSEPDGWD